MPFCMTDLYKNSISSITLKLVTLQVRIPLKNRNKILGTCHDRKAFLSASGSLTLEASLVLALLIFAMTVLILPMRILNTERKIQASLESVGEDFSKYAYLQRNLKDGLESLVPGASAWAKEFCHQLETGIAENYIEEKVMEHADTALIQQITMKESEFLDDGEWFDLILNYEIRMPFPVLGLDAVSCTARCRRRAWIGKEGKDDDGENDTDTTEEMVYIGKNPTRYHRKRSCHYLANDLTAVSFDEIEALRNQNGGKYHACAVCAGNGDTGSTVYIMPSGSSYHSSKTCTAIIAYVKMVPLSEVAHLGACSYCGN